MIVQEHFYTKSNKLAHAAFDIIYCGS